MKKEGHPAYYETTVTCACGSTFKTGSTRKAISVDICAVCHPFYTGKQKFVDTAGRVERFQRKYGWGQRQAESPPASPPAPEAGASATAAEDKKA